MTDLPQQDDQKEHRSIDLLSMAATFLALLYLIVAVLTSNLDDKLKHFGLTLILICLGAASIHLRDRKANERPPVLFSPFVKLMMAGFCLGTIFLGASMPNPVGMIVEIVPTTLIVGYAIWSVTPMGKAKRAELAARNLR